MRPSKQLVILPAMAALLLGTPSVAQTRFCIGGDLGHLSVAQRSACDATLQNVRSMAVALHAPADWHFVVVCGEDGWKQYLALAGENARTLENAPANTDLLGHETFFRERDLEAGGAVASSRVVAHEVATIQLRTTEEVAVQTQMTQLLGKVQPAAGL